MAFHTYRGVSLQPVHVIHEIRYNILVNGAVAVLDMAFPIRANGSSKLAEISEISQMQKNVHRVVMDVPQKSEPF